MPKVAYGFGKTKKGAPVITSSKQMGGKKQTFVAKGKAKK